MNIMKKIAVVTTTRAEYGLLFPIIEELRKFENEELRIVLIVSGTHLSEKFGMTVGEIEASGVRIDQRIKTRVESESGGDISRNQADVLERFSKLFDREKYNALVLLGDRYEILAVAMAATNAGIPIFHISGGDITQGAIDDCIRHSVTKMSYLHFTTNEQSKNRVIQLGEEPSRVFNFGSTSMGNILHMELLSKADAMKSVGIKNESYALCTYHPVTLEKGGIEKNLLDFFEVIKQFKDIDFVVTKSNADQGGEQINHMLDDMDSVLPNIHVYPSLGVKRYLSLMKYASFVLGNSSSGIVEAPAFHVPTVNIGDRQRGRLAAESVINCRADAESITAAIKTAMSPEMKEVCKAVVSPYGDGYAAEKTAAQMIQTLKKGIDLKKRFFDIKFVL